MHISMKFLMVIPKLQIKDIISYKKVFIVIMVKYYLYDKQKENNLCCLLSFYITFLSHQIYNLYLLETNHFQIINCQTNLFLKLPVLVQIKDYFQVMNNHIDIPHQYNHKAVAVAVAVVGADADQCNIVVGNGLYYRNHLDFHYILLRKK